VLPHIFELFFQGPRGRERQQGGLGLGLAIVQNLVRLHGGEVEAHSEGSGRGSEFVVRLPVSQGDEAPSQIPTPIFHPQQSRAHRVLVVDDNADAAESLGEILTSYGHEVRVAHDAPEALQVVEQFEPQVAVLDIGLPVMDGIELGARLQARFGSALRLFALTGYGQAEERSRTARNGFEHHFVKPLDPAVLARCISESAAPTHIPRPGDIATGARG
jgi:CheY-like chemotaxis protein